QAHQAHSLTVGHTAVLSSSTVNTFRVTWNKTHAGYHLAPWFGGEDVGVKDFYNYLPGYMRISISGAFSLSASYLYANNINQYQGSDDLTMVRGNHQFGFGANLANSRFYVQDANPA